MGATKSRKPGWWRARRSCKPPRGGAGALGLPRGRAKSFAADSSSLREGAGHLRFNAKVAWGGLKGRLEARGSELPLKPLPPFMPPGGGANVPLLAALQLEGVAGSRRRRGGRAPGAIWRSPQGALVVAKVLGAARRREVGTFANQNINSPIQSGLIQQAHRSNLDRRF